MSASPPLKVEQQHDTSATPVASETAATSAQQVPDGGIRAWLTVLGGWIVMFCTFGYANSFGVFQDFYQFSGTSTSSNISWIGSLQMCLLFAMGLPAGKLFDHGYFHHIQIGGGLLYVFSLFMLSLADPRQYYQLFLSQGVGMGLGAGLMFVPALSVQTHYWRKRRALAMGIVLSGTSCGGIVYPIMLNQLFNGSAGFAWGVRASAFLTLGLLAVANLSMRPRFSTTKVMTDLPPSPKLKKVLRDVPYLLTISGSTLVLWGLYFPYFYLQLFVNLHDVSPTLAFYSLSILNASSIFGRTFLNLLADGAGQFNVVCPVAICSAGLLFVMFSATNTANVIVFAILYGFFSGGFSSLIPPTIAALSPDLTEIGIRMGIGFFMNSFGLLTGTPITGALLKRFQWFKPIIFSGAVICAGTTSLLIARHIMTKRKNSQHV